MSEEYKPKTIETALRMEWQGILNKAIKDGRELGIHSSTIVNEMLTVAFCNKAHLDGGEAANRFYTEAAEAFLKIQEDLTPNQMN